jgi:hypothetical protein
VVFFGVIVISIEKMPLTSSNHSITSSHGKMNDVPDWNERNASIHRGCRVTRTHPLSDLTKSLITQINNAYRSKHIWFNGFVYKYTPISKISKKTVRVRGTDFYDSIIYSTKCLHCFSKVDFFSRRYYTNHLIHIKALVVFHNSPGTATPSKSSTTSNTAINSPQQNKY